MAADDPRKYATPAFWDDRYSKQNSSFEWYQDFNGLKNVIIPLLPPATGDVEFEILIPGCGSSEIGAELYGLGYLNITSIDTSEVLIEQLSERYAHLEDMEHAVMDATAMDCLPEGCFDFVLDKALLDSLLCANDGGKQGALLLRQIRRVLKPGGIFMLVSHAPPDRRLPALQKEAWSIRATNVAKPMLHAEGSEDAAAVAALQATAARSRYHVYTCTKSGLKRRGKSTM